MTSLQTEGACSRGGRALAWSVLFAYCLFSGIKYSENIILIQALGGWSPMDWAAHQLLPQNFKEDFPSGISAYQMSSLMKLYVFVASLGGNLEILVPWVIHFEVAFLGVSAAVLYRALVPHMSYIAMAIFALLIVEGSVRDMDLARFGGAFYQGLFYNIADGLRLLGLAALFRGRIAIAALLLGLGFTVHPVMVGIACLFAVPYVLLSFGRFTLRHWLLAGTVFLSVAGGWILLNIRTSEIASGGIPSDEWIGLVRMFTYHWFPVDIGVFTRLHERYIIPLFCLVSLAALYLSSVIKGRAERFGIAWGMGLLTVLVCAGVLISEFSSEPFLIKLALHRASEMLIFVSLLIVVAGLTEEVLNGRILEASLGGALLLSPLVNAPYAFPIVAVIGIAVIYIVRARNNNASTQFQVGLTVLILLLFVVSLCYVFGVPNTQAYLGSTNPGYLGWPVFWMVALVFFIVGVLGWFCDRMNLSLAIAKVGGGALLGAVLIYSTASLERKVLMPDERKEFAYDYLAVQRWARANTSHDSLFMVDPTICYGWRDFSQRSSFGNIREWLHTSWLYDSQLGRYQEGLRRFGEFGIDIEPYKQIRPSIEGYHRLSDDLRRAFYLKDRVWFEDVSRRYGISYVVVQRKFVNREVFLDSVFENSGFVVYRLGE